MLTTSYRAQITIILIGLIFQCVALLFKIFGHISSLTACVCVKQEKTSTQTPFFTVVFPHPFPSLFPQPQLPHYFSAHIWIAGKHCQHLGNLCIYRVHQRDRIMVYMKVSVNYTLVYNVSFGSTKRKTTFKSVRNVHEYVPQTCKYDFKENLHP